MSHAYYHVGYVPSGESVAGLRKLSRVDDVRGIVIEKIHIKGSSNQAWCPSLSAKVSPKIGPLNPTMVAVVSSILRSLGEDPIRKELVGMPSQFVKWLLNFRSIDMDEKLNGSLLGRIDSEVNFHDKQVCSELNLPFWSQCAHHLLLFHGVVHIGYFVSNGYNRIGKSLLQSIIHFNGFKLQVQERLTRQIAETIVPLLGGNVIVVIEASHTCMISKGLKNLEVVHLPLLCWDIFNGPCYEGHILAKYT